MTYWYQLISNAALAFGAQFVPDFPEVFQDANDWLNCYCNLYRHRYSGKGALCCRGFLSFSNIESKAYLSSRHRVQLLLLCMSLIVSELGLGVNDNYPSSRSQCTADGLEEHGERARVIE